MTTVQKTQKCLLFLKVSGIGSMRFLRDDSIYYLPRSCHRRENGSLPGSDRGPEVKNHSSAECWVRRDPLGSPSPVLFLAGLRENLQSLLGHWKEITPAIKVTGYHPQVEARDCPVGERTSLSLLGSQLGLWDKLTTVRGTEKVDKCIHV